MLDIGAGEMQFDPRLGRQIRPRSVHQHRFDSGLGRAECSCVVQGRERARAHSSGHRKGDHRVVHIRCELNQLVIEKSAGSGKEAAVAPTISHRTLMNCPSTLEGLPEFVGASDR